MAKEFEQLLYEFRKAETLPIHMRYIRTESSLLPSKPSALRTLLHFPRLFLLLSQSPGPRVEAFIMNNDAITNVPLSTLNLFAKTRLIVPWLFMPVQI
jgi:hypothetical protein